MARWFRVIEIEDGAFACRFGLTEYDRHASVSLAVDHVSHIAAEYSPAQVFLHLHDGTVHRVADI